MNTASAPGPTRDDRAPSAHVRRHLGFSWIWLLPLGALALVGYLIYDLVAERGPLIAISFDTAEGLRAGETPVKYKAVNLGVVEDVELADDRSHVVAKVRMDSKASALLGAHARFWVVRPRLTGGLTALQSGLETLVSGAYIAVDPGAPGGARQSSFKGLEKPPSTRSDEPGTVYFLSAQELGGLSEGAPVYYRGVTAGELLSYEIDERTGAFSLRIFVHAPYDARVVAATRFWNGSGIKVGTSALGLNVELDSVRALVSGSIDFGNPPNSELGPRAKAESKFDLFSSRAEAETGFYGSGPACVSYFRASASGLQPGSPVNLFGERVGSVTSVELARDRRPGARGELVVRVGYHIEPGRAHGETEREALSAEGLRALVRDRLGAVLESSSFLLGAKELSLEYVAGTGPVELANEGENLVVPGEVHDLGQLTTNLSGIVAKIDAIPFQSIGEHADRALAAIERTAASPELPRAIAALEDALREAASLARQAKADVGPAMARLPVISAKLEQAANQAQAAFGASGYGPDSTTQRNLEHVLDEVAGAARSVRLLADYLDRHPEALISGRREDAP